MAIETIPILNGNSAINQVAADQVGSTYYPVTKLAFGADGTVTLVEATVPLPVAQQEGTYGYASGITVGTVTPPTGAKLKRVNVVAAVDQSASVAIGGGDVITIPANAEFDEVIPGIALNTPVVINGSIQMYYVAWTL